MTNPTKAIWYRVLGDKEYGQCTIVADESEGIEESLEIMSILKDGYQTKHKVPRMDSDNKKPEWYYPFCEKIIICENSPSEHKAKGLLDRSIKIKTHKGYPKYDIKEVRNPQGNKQRQRRLDELNALRKLLLIFKLYHRDPLPEIDIGLDGRDKELCKPTIQLFYGTGSQKEIEETLQHLIDIKNERKKQSLEAMIYPIVISAVSGLGVKIPSKKMWELITNSLEGELDNNNQYLFNTSDHKIYINTVTKIICDKFGAESKHERQGNVLIFDGKDLVKAGKIYSESNKILTKPIEDCEPCEPCEAPWSTEKPFYMHKYCEFHTEDSDLIENLEENDLKKVDTLYVKYESEPISASHASRASQYPHHCYRCDFEPVNKQEYESHCFEHHKGFSGYPNMASIVAYGLEPQGMDWE